MSITQIPSKSPQPSRPPVRPDGSELYEAQHWESAYRKFDADAVPHLLLQLEDDLARSRKREAAWLSVIVHLLLIILILNEARLEKYFFRPVVVVSPNDLDRQKELTFLALPPDQQKVTRRPDTNIISDKDRVATSRKPQLDPKELKKILDAARRGRPGPNGSPTPPGPQQQPQVAQNAAQQPQSQPQQAPPPAPTNEQQTAQLQPPPVPKAKAPVTFKGSMSAGSAITEAARAAMANPGGSYGGDSGDYGLGQGQRGGRASQLEVLTDTMGVDFGPYLSRVVLEVKQHWYNIIPEGAQWKKGKVAIDFAILKDGSVAGMKLEGSSGDVALDRPAWGSITGSNPFEPLPQNFHGQYLGLRFRFYYNPDKADLE